MKQNISLTILFYFIFHFNVFSQQHNGFVTGKIIEDSTKLPLEFVTVGIVNSNDSNSIKGVGTDQKGNFKIDSVKAGTYFLRISFIGFETKETPSFSVTENTETVLGIISLKVSEILLKDVIVTADKTLMVNSIDRKVYFPAQDIQAQTGSASEVLENIPSVSVDVDGVVSLRGSANVTFLINGKPSGLMKAAGATALQQIPASLIERIEIITNPSAKYKPDGTAGIINIVLKKDFKPGFNGTISGSASTHERYNSNISFNYNPGKINLYGTYGFKQFYFSRQLTDSRINRDTTQNAPTFFELNSTATGKPISHTTNFGVDYLVSPKNKISLSSNYFYLQQNRDNNFSTLENNNDGTLVNDYNTQRKEDESEYEWETQASLEHSFKKKDQTLNLETTYGKFNELEDSRYTDTYHVPLNSPLTGHNNIHKSGSNSTLVCNYTNPIGEDMELEAGYEGEFSKGELEYFSEQFDITQNSWLTDYNKTKRFLYTQNIHAAYTTFSIDIDEFSILAGVRAEQTNITSNLVTLDSVILNNYFKVFPSFHLSYETGKNSKIGLSYSKRINRPDPDELNPFPEYKNPRNIEAGNPRLLPEQIHSVELNYQIKKNNFNFIPALYYRYTYDEFAEITRYVNDSTLLTTLDNISTNKATGLELIFSYNYIKIMNLAISGNVFHNTINASKISYAKNNSSVSWDSKLNATFNLSSKTKLQLNANYRSVTLTAQGKSLSLYFLNAGMKQELFKNKASLTLTVSDIFNTMRWEYTIDTDKLYQKESRKRKSQIIYVGFVWRFGFTSKKSNDELQFDNKL